MATPAQYLGTGKRKTSVARVILRPGDGATWINGKKIEDPDRDGIKYRGIYLIAREWCARSRIYQLLAAGGEIAGPLSCGQNGS